MRYLFLLNIIIFIFIALFNGCNWQSNIEKKAHPVPNVFINAIDKGFEYVQDTVYYKQKHFSGYQFELYPSGDTGIIKSFYNGLEEGYSKKWYPNKKPSEVRFYKAGKKEGIHQAWWLNGKLKFLYVFSNDEFNGVSKEWYENGMPFKEFNYKDGHEDGSIKMWWINGKARANYVIKNGRRYGLLGTKNCINVADSVSFNR